jgi:hypothetical protein
MNSDDASPGAGERAGERPVGFVSNEERVGWWWADPLTALAIAGVAVREGWETWNGDPCCEDDAILQAQGPGGHGLAGEDDGCNDECCC